MISDETRRILNLNQEILNVSKNSRSVHKYFCKYPPKTEHIPIPSTLYSRPPGSGLQRISLKKYSNSNFCLISFYPLIPAVCHLCYNVFTVAGKAGLGGSAAPAPLTSTAPLNSTNPFLSIKAVGIDIKS